MNWKFWIKKPKNISEPVITLCNEILEYDNWTYVVASNTSGTYWHRLCHKEKDIRLSFQRDFFNDKWYCSQAYLSTDEKDYLGEAFTAWLFEYDHEQKLQEEEKQQKERQRIAKELGL